MALGTYYDTYYMPGPVLIILGPQAYLSLKITLRRKYDFHFVGKKIASERLYHS